MLCHKFKCVSITTLESNFTTKQKSHGEFPSRVLGWPSDIFTLVKHYTSHSNVVRMRKANVVRMRKAKDSPFGIPYIVYSLSCNNNIF
jgi:hypothetical protein